MPSLHFVSFPIYRCNIRVFGAIFLPKSNWTSLSYRGGHVFVLTQKMFRCSPPNPFFCGWQCCRHTRSILLTACSTRQEDLQPCMILKRIQKASESAKHSLAGLISKVFEPQSLLLSKVPIMSTEGVLRPSIRRQNYKKGNTKDQEPSDK